MSVKKRCRMLVFSGVNNDMSGYYQRKSLESAYWAKAKEVALRLGADSALSTINSRLEMARFVGD